MKITAKMLQAKGACDDQVQEFRKRWPDGLTLTSEEQAREVALSVAQEFDWGWAAENMLSPEGRQEYWRVRAAARQEYERVKDAARQEYERVTEPARQEYERVRDAAWQEYERVKDVAWQEYLRVRDAARQEYERATEPARREYLRVSEPAMQEYQNQCAVTFAVLLFREGAG